MADLTASLQEHEDKNMRRRESAPSVVPLYVLSFVILSGAIVAFIEMGNNLSAKSSAITNLTQNLTTLQSQFSTLSQNLATTQSNLNTVNSSLNGQIKTLSSNVNSTNNQVQNLSTQVSAASANVSTLSGTVTTLSSSVSNVTAATTALQGQVTGLLTPVSVPLTITPVNGINLTTTTSVTTGTTFAVTTSNLANITGNGYVSCSAAVVFSSNVAGPTLNIGYVLGTGKFTSAFTSTVSSTSNNVGFAVVNIQVGTSDNNQPLSFQYAFTSATTTELNVTNVATSASCSWFA